MQIYQPKEGYCYNSDTLFLYDFALKSLKPKKQVLEVGSGSGVLGLLCAREVEMDLAMIEKNPKMLELCQHNLRVNKIRANLIGGDFLEYDFNIDLDDIVLPKVCPLLNIPLSINSNNKDYSYSLDKIDPKKGYVKGNVWVISFRANKIKNDASLSELELLTSNLRKYTTNEDN